MLKMIWEKSKKESIKVTIFSIELLSFERKKHLRVDKIEKYIDNFDLWTTKEAGRVVKWSEKEFIIILEGNFIISKFLSTLRS